MVKIGREKTRPNTVVSAASVRGRTLADKVYYMATYIIPALRNPRDERVSFDIQF